MSYSTQYRSKLEANSHSNGLLELSKLLDLKHEIAAIDVFHDEVETVHRLEAGVKVDKERWPVAHGQNILLHHGTVDIVVLDNAILLQNLDGVQLVCALSLG